jgi:cytochrome P450
MAGTEFVNNELDKIITQLKATREAEAKRKSLLDNVLNLGGIGRTENNEIHIDGKVQDLTHEELRSALLQFFIAGFETTATTLTYGLQPLCSN